MYIYTHRYRNRLFVTYNISCGPGRLAFYNVTSLDLDPQVCNERYVHYPPATVYCHLPGLIQFVLIYTHLFVDVLTMWRWTGVSLE